ncbi:M28 family metallopeptidase [Saccharopolyspora sp. 6V]|uniref:M28 family metallopeptidase n=1 Tax=Saccharopolyspora sp. 6V TaxID=2877239 RepID=UPI001CD33FEB|nr:M28 family peptidase [Saccharopolyspora sp. 6V]MCA1192870.1 M28 family peptidase [Saccharopolyspora sp. 6V]
MTNTFKPELLPSTDKIFNTIHDLVSIGPRRTGTPEGKSSAYYVADTFRALGITDVRIDECHSTRWEADHWGLTVGGADVPCFPVTHSFIGENDIAEFSTGSDGYTARLVDLDSSPTAEELTGAIVIFDVHFIGSDVAAEAGHEISTSFPDGTLPEGKLIDPYHTSLPDIIPRLVQSGAVGFIAVLADYFDSNRYINEDIGDIPIPGMWITRRQANEVRARLRATPVVEATLSLHGRREPATGYSPVAVLPGRSSESILIHSHHDSVWSGAVEDASGTAVVIALAEYFASIPIQDRARTLIFASMDTHFTGYEAHQAFVDKYVDHPEDGREILIDIAIEHIARSGRVVDGELVTGDESELRLVLHRTGQKVEDLLVKLTSPLDRIMLLPTSFLPTAEMPTDADFHYQAGIPVISFISAPIYLYDECDTLDKVDRDQLRPITGMFAELATELLDEPRKHFHP